MVCHPQNVGQKDVSSFLKWDCLPCLRNCLVQGVAGQVGADEDGAKRYGTVWLMQPV